MNEIASRIENPSITKAQDSEDLKQLAEKYPYTQLFSILYLQSLKQAGDIHFEDELKKHSFRITDRAQLFNLIESAHSVSAEPATVVEEEKVEEIVEEIIETVEEESQASAPLSPRKAENEETQDQEEEKEVVAPVAETKDEEESDSNRIVEESQTSTPLSPPKLEKEEIVPNEPELVVDEPEIEPESNEIKETVSAWTEPISEVPEVEETVVDSSESEPVVEETQITEDVIEESETTEIVSEKEPEKEELYSVEEAFKDEPEVEADVKDQLDQTIEHHIYAANYQLDGLSPEEERKLKEKEAQNRKETTETGKIESDNDQIEEDLSFTSWLQANDNYVEPEEEVVTAKVVPEFSDFDPSNPLFGEQERPKQEFFSAPKKAKKSLTEETVPVSETLAKVYAMQGNYPKAIVAYEQLMLTIPEKKSFFASLIEDLKTKLNT
ncbi:MAG: hypothetical protein P8P74_06600 [Crocinitomicaceae bacterium]|nr:hypothetical protein [Crocinitomicaceae bacterium]